MLGKLIKSNFRKDMSHMISFMLIVILSSSLLQLGLMLVRGYNSQFEEKVRELNSPDLMVMTEVDDPEQEAEIMDYISKIPEVDYYEKVPVINLDSEEVRDGVEVDTKNAMETVLGLYSFAPYGEWGEIDRPQFVELADKECDNPIYLSRVYNQDVFQGRYHVGDEMTLKVNGHERVFTVAGFYESVSLYNLFYIDPAMLAELNSDDKAPVDQIVIKLVDGADIDEIYNTMANEFSDRGIDSAVYSISEFKLMYTQMINMIAVFLCAFSLIVTLVVMIVIYFRITNSIEQNITNIGALKALGYTTHQIRTAQILEFVLTAGIGVLVSTVLIYMIISPLEVVLRSLAYMTWDHPFDLPAFTVTALAIVGASFLVALRSTRSIKGLDPVIALRFGLKSHSFRKNRAPLETTSGPLVWLMAIKSALTSMKQNILIFVVMCAIGVSLAMAVFVGYNVGVHPLNLQKLLSGDSPDVQLIVDNGDDIIYEVQDFPYVEEAWWKTSATASYQGTSIQVDITEDWSSISECGIMEGRAPMYDDEVAIGLTLARAKGLMAGDMILLETGDRSCEYTITGFVQGQANYGNFALMNEDGAAHLGVECPKRNIYIMVEGHGAEKSAVVIDNAEAVFGDRLELYLNYPEGLSNGENPTIMLGRVICIVLVVISLAVIWLTMMLLIKTIIIKKQKELGIKKALGFTSNQLRTELSLSMLPAIVTGLVSGAAVGILNANRFFTILLSAFGIAQSNMAADLWMGILVVAFGVVASYIMVYALSARIKKISAYSLITE
ncbi:MAG: ABC transporter permease [Clostridiales bacterium]|nr:ABC transporter permease [Clostridiales bacterium]